MIDSATLPLYLAAVALIMLTPGPDMLLVTTTAAYQGFRSSLYMALGIALSRSTHVALSGAGIAALLATSPQAFEVMRYAGALYMLWLAWQSLYGGAAQQQRSNVKARFWPCFRKGLITNLLNPKALVFCSLFLPQFIAPQQGNLPGQFLVLGSILVGSGLALDMLYAWGAARLGRRLGENSRTQGPKWIQSTLFTGLALRLILMENGVAG
ncbi:MAG TPA: LysE family translocator [Motiliproteus sp.]